MKKCVNGKYIELTPEEITAMQKEASIAEMQEKTRPLTEAEVSRLFIRQNINTVITDDATASRAVEFHPEMLYNGALIEAGTRINWKGTLKRAAVDLWDTETNTPEKAPKLWEDIAYRDGIRIIPETITVGLAFSKDEPGWWGEVIYISNVDNNVYTPEQYKDNWRTLEE